MTTAERRPSTAGDVLRRIKEDNVRFLDLKFVGLFGGLHHVTWPTEVVDEGLFRDGAGFDGSSVPGFQSIHESDMVLLPDPATVFPDPFFDEPTLSVFCDIIDPAGLKPYSRDPRGVAKRAERYLKTLGIADTAFFGPEMEFFIFDTVRYDQTTQHGYYYIDADEAFWNSGRSDPSLSNLGGRAARKRSYCAPSPVDHSQNLRSKISSVLREVGLETELHHHEVAGGQHEIGFRFGTLTRQADSAIKFKYVTKNVARRYGKSATFMPKPLFEENGSGMHVHTSLWNGDRNLFYQADGYAGLSRMATHFVGGLLHHAAALCAFCAPTTNSYRRLVPGYEAPMNLVYSQRNRSACIRVPMFARSPKSKRIEFRTPDPSSNPYLVFAAILLAGLDGIRHQIEPPAPVDEDIYELARTERGARIARTPGSLDEAIAALAKDNAFLLEGGVFTPDLIEMWIELKRRQEIDYVRLRPHPAEFSLYYNV